MANSILHSKLRVPVRGAKFNVVIPFDNQDDATETFDTEISKDNGAFADCTNELEIIGGGTSCDIGFLTLTATETACDLVVLKLSAVSGVKPTLVDFEVCDLPVLYSGTAVAGSTTQATLQVSNRPDFDLALVECIFRNNTTGEARHIKTYTGLTGVATFAAMETAVAAGHTYDVLLPPEQSALDYWASILIKSGVDSTLVTVTAQLPDVVNAAFVRGAVGMSAANLDTQLASIKTDSGTTIPGTLTTINGKLDTIDARLDTEIPSLISSMATVVSAVSTIGTTTVSTLAAVDTEVAAIKAKTDNLPSAVDGKTLTEWFQIVGAMAAGDLSGAGTGTEVLKGLDNTTTRITATVDGSGNRTVVTA